MPITYKDLNRQLRGKSTDWSFLSSMAAVSGPQASRLARLNRLQRDPKLSWVFEPNAIQKIINQMFPAWEFDRNQKERAGLYAAIFQMYFSVGMTAGQIVFEFQDKVTNSEVRRIIHNIKQAHAGLTSNGKPRKQHGRGRPRKHDGIRL